MSVETYASVEFDSSIEVDATGFDLLFEPDLLSQAYDEGDVEIRQAEEYAYLNELTNAFEAVTLGKISETYKSMGVDGQLYAHGQPVLEMFERALNPDLPDWQYRRIDIEIEEARQVRDWINSDRSDQVNILKISPYPEEASEKQAKDLGYKPKERLGKLRLHTKLPDSRVATIELGLGNSDVEIYKQLLDSLGMDTTDIEDAGDVLAQTIELDKSVSIERLAQIYDQLLCDRDGRYYFCGQGDGRSLLMNYEDLTNRRLTLESVADPIVRLLVDVDREIAKKLTLGYSRKELEREKADALIRCWSAISVLIGEGNAAKAFGDKQASKFKKQLSRCKSVADFRRVIFGAQFSSIVENSEVSFSGCGGSLSTSKNKLLGKNVLKCVTCPFCHQQVDALIVKQNYQWFIKCPSCKAMARK